MQTVTAPVLPEFVIWGASLLTFAYLAYKLYYKKEKAFQKLFSGVHALGVMVMFVALAVLPTEVYLMFGPMSGFFEVLVGEILVSILSGAFMAVLFNIGLQVYLAEKSKAGF